MNLHRSRECLFGCENVYKISIFYYFFLAIILRTERLVTLYFNVVKQFWKEKPYMIDQLTERKNMMTAIEFVASLPMPVKSSKVDYDEQKAAANIKHQLIERKKLHFRRRQLNDIMCIISLFGLALMIIDTELRLNEVNTTIMIFIRLLISISTVLLVGFVFYYHALDIRLYTINNHIVDWRVTLSIRAIVTILCEVVVCAIHPFPFNDKMSSNESAWLKIFLTLPSK